jgi:hypothetical protein
VSRDSSVGIVTDYGLESWDSIPGGGRIFLFSIVSRPTLRPTLPHIEWVPGAISAGVKRPESETDHLPLSSAEVKSGGAIPPLLCLRGIVLN